MVKTRRKPAAEVLALRDGGRRSRPSKGGQCPLALREEFARVVEDLGGVEGLAQSFPAVRRAVMEAIDGALPANAEDVFRPRVERRLAPLFRMAGLDMDARLGLVTFAILHRTWEAQRLFLEALGEELHQAARGESRR
ncbi:MAG: hypothetical protein HY720_15490 [Planctomycetes bacterium]|nr:hypothetical protein [Planctomycetota bacterium]